MHNTKLIFDPNLFQISLGKHHDKKVIWVKFNYDINLIHLLRSQAKAYWSASQKAWYLIDNYHHRNLCGIELDIVGKEVLSKISETNMPEFFEISKHTYAQKLFSEYHPHLFY
ncbi:MAG: integrase [Bacteroidetes bacterium OLB11]|nr:MAG: integrase [Bacteroidetes bacterium OLB11]